MSVGMTNIGRADNAPTLKLPGQPGVNLAFLSGNEVF